MVPSEHEDGIADGVVTTKSHLLQAIDQNDVKLAHRYRLSLPSKPQQSSFRVLALIFYENLESDEDKDVITGNQYRPGLPTLAPWMAHTTTDGRSFVVGSNDECGYMGGAICAERAALVQLRFLPRYRVVKVVITTDSIDPITPGILCREFLAGHASVPWDVPVITTGCICIQCNRKNESLFWDQAKSENNSTGNCCDDHAEHSFPTIHTTLRSLYPYPSPYTRLTATESVALGETYSARASQDFESLEEPDSKRLLELAIMEARTHVSELHPIQFGAAVIFDDGVIVTSHQICALEYGCTLDAVSQLAPHFQDGATPLLLVQADQYGIAHAPFAPARAFLSEHGYENCQVVVHDVPCSDDAHDVLDMNRWTLKEVFVTDLAPNAPTWTEGTERGE